MEIANDLRVLTQIFLISNCLYSRNSFISNITFENQQKITFNFTVGDHDVKKQRRKLNKLIWRTDQNLFLTIQCNDILMIYQISNAF